MRELADAIGLTAALSAAARAACPAGLVHDPGAVLRDLVVTLVSTVQRYVLVVCGRWRGRGPTVRVADGEPGDELQIDFGRMGLVPDPATARRRVTHALIFTACYSRHCFVWLTHRQTTETVVAGHEAAWGSSVACSAR